MGLPVRTAAPERPPPGTTPRVASGISGSPDPGGAAVDVQGWETDLFGGAYDEAKPFERCKYGALGVAWTWGSAEGGYDQHHPGAGGL